jgi:hypothetical protein
MLTVILIESTKQSDSFNVSSFSIGRETGGLAKRCIEKGNDGGRAEKNLTFDAIDSSSLKTALSKATVVSFAVWRR